jgi:predicted GNAT family acetyltransferase
MKQTAVEWLVEKLNKQGFAQVVTNEEIEQAKEMEKQQIIGAHIVGLNQGLYGYKNSEEYYKKTFKNK